MKPILIISAFLLLCIFAKAQQADTMQKNQVFKPVLQMPQFASGPDAFKAYLAKNLNYPAKAARDNIQGKVLLSFIVEKDGSLSDVKILKGVSPEIDAEALRVINISPKWKPAIQNGRAIRFNCTLPISFKLPLPGVAEAMGTMFPHDSVVTYFFVPHMPSFPGGAQKFAEYIRTNLRYPDEAQKKGIQGKVFLSFIIERDGSLKDIRVIRGIGNGCDEEAIRLLKDGPKWDPGTLDGQGVRVAYNMPMPIEFSLAPK